jgi:hypothetical protein
MEGAAKNTMLMSGLAVCKVIPGIFASPAAK